MFDTDGNHLSSINLSSVNRYSTIIYDIAVDNDGIINVLTQCQQSEENKLGCFQNKATLGGLKILNVCPPQSILQSGGSMVIDHMNNRIISGQAPNMGSNYYTTDSGVYYFGAQKGSGVCYFGAQKGSGVCYFGAQKGSGVCYFGAQKGSGVCYFGAQKGSGVCYFGAQKDWRNTVPLGCSNRCHDACGLTLYKDGILCVAGYNNDVVRKL